MELKGKVFKYGDDVDTDVIIPARFLVTSDPNELKAHCFEDLDKDFVSKVESGDIVVAGTNFGCGSSREHATIALKASGVSCVIAKSFARIFYRNAINIGLPILECDMVDKVNKGDNVTVDLKSGTVINVTSGEIFKAKPFPDFILDIIRRGGLMA